MEILAKLLFNMVKITACRYHSDIIDGTIPPSRNGVELGVSMVVQ